jgi:sialic acid synthase SpsE
VRTQIIAELASNHGGNLDLAQEMIRAAAGAGCEWVKLQLFDASKLADTDPQKAWLTQSQVDRRFLDECLATAAESGVRLTASVFGIPEAQMALDAGLTTIKLGSGEVRRSDLSLACAVLFGSSNVWMSHGLYFDKPHDFMSFYSISQYPTPYMRGLALLTQCDKFDQWGWSDHGADLEVAKEAMLHGATYVERHFSYGKEARWQAWDTDVEGLKELRKHADDCAWEGTESHQAACAAYLGRWGSE